LSATVAGVQGTSIVTVIAPITVVVGVLNKASRRRIVVADLVGLPVAISVDGATLVVGERVRTSGTRLSARHSVLVADARVVLLIEKFSHWMG
jgi:ABC-type uncharacterized transport system YnjBCD ATPase subunit